MICRDYEKILLEADCYESIDNLMKLLDKENEFNGLFDRLRVDQLNKYHKYNIRDHIVYTVLGVESNIELRWAALLHDIGKKDAMTIDSNGIGHFIGHPKISRDMSYIIVNALKRDLNYNDKVCLNILKLIELHDSLNFIKRKSIRDHRIREFISVNGYEMTVKVLKLKEADTNAQSELSITLKKEIGNELIKSVNKVMVEGSAFKEQDLAINRQNLLELGINKDRLDNVIHILLKNVWGEPKNNNYETLIKIAKHIK